MSAEPFADYSFSPGRKGRHAATTARLLETGVEPRRGVAVNAFIVAQAAVSGGDLSASRAGAAR
jgi:hypothetical protein